VVTVEAVLAQQFPVGIEAIGLGAADDFHGGLGLVQHQVDVFQRATQVGLQIIAGRLEVHEVQPAVLLEARHAHEIVHAALARTFPIALVARSVDQAAFQVEGPGVIEAAEHRAIAGGLAAYQRATMRTGVEERARRAVLAAREQDVAAGDLACQVVTGLLYFGFVTEIQPAVFEYGQAFARQDVGVGKGAPRDAEHSARTVIIEQGGRADGHSRLPF
jgi:hypothetical protein